MHSLSKPELTSPVRTSAYTTKWVKCPAWENCSLHSNPAQPLCTVHHTPIFRSDTKLTEVSGDPHWSLDQALYL